MEISLLTDVGQKRTNNQDYANQFVNRAGMTMILLADGMGGHRPAILLARWLSQTLNCCLGGHSN